MENQKIIAGILLDAGIRSFGICPFPDETELLPCRNAVTIPKSPKAVIVCAFPYYTDPSIPSNLCLYARVPDYHLVVRDIFTVVCQKLADAFPGHRFVGFSDVSALPERSCALRAGIGFLGKNNMIIHPEYGSFFVIGEIVTDLALPFSEPMNQSCKNCGACIQNCPGGALGEDHFCEEKCLSYITQRKGILTPEEEALIKQGGLVWGCDRCQLVCPHNKDLPVTPIAAFADHIEPFVTEENFAALKKERSFGYRGRTLMMRNLALFADEKTEKN